MGLERCPGCRKALEKMSRKTGLQPWICVALSTCTSGQQTPLGVGSSVTSAWAGSALMIHADNSVEVSTRFFFHPAAMLSYFIIRAAGMLFDMLDVMSYTKLFLLHSVVRLILKAKCYDWEC